MSSEGASQLGQVAGCMRTSGCMVVAPPHAASSTGAPQPGYMRWLVLDNAERL